MRWRQSVLTTAVMVLGVGCAAKIAEDPANNPSPGDSLVTTEDNGDGTFTTTVDASVEERWAYFDLHTGQQLQPEDPANDLDWDLAFSRFLVVTNGGSSGSGDVRTARRVGVDFQEMTHAPSDGYVQDEPDSDDEGSEPDSAFLVGDMWYSYHPTDHTLTARDAVYVVHSDDAYFKVQMLAYYDEAGTAGYPKFHWGPVLAPNGDMPPPEGLHVDASEGEWAYLSLRNEATVRVDEPEMSDEWDIAFNGPQVRTNGGVSGSGYGGARLPGDGDGFEDIDTSPVTGFVVDGDVEASEITGESSYRGSPILAHWYSEDSSPDDLQPSDTTFLVRTAIGAYYKLEIVSYDAGVYQLEAEFVPRDLTPQNSLVSSGDPNVWVYLSFRDGEVVQVEDSSESLAWDLGLSASKVQTNGGTSGPGACSAIESEAVSLDELLAAPVDAGCYLPTQGHVCDCALPEVECVSPVGIWTEQCACENGYSIDEILPVPGSSDNGEFSGNPALNTWYEGDPDTEDIAPRPAVFLIKTADGGIVKAQFIDYVDGDTSLTWVYAGAGRTDFRP